MKYLLPLLALLATDLSAQMEKRQFRLYVQKTFEKREPAVGTKLGNLTLRDLSGKKLSLSTLSKKPLVIIAGAYT